jgi:hypothetical protein
VSKLERSTQVAQIVSAFVVSVSVAIGLLAYLNDINTQRLEFTFQKASEYESSQLVVARNELFLAIQNAQLSVAPARLAALDLNTYLEKSYSETAEVGRRETVEAALQVAGFFNSASNCVRADLCDLGLMKEFLGAEARQFQCVFSGIVELAGREANVQGLMAGVEIIASGECVQ